MSGQLNNVYAGVVRDALNAYAGKDSDAVEAMVALPKKLWLAVAYFAAYEVYQMNALGLLNGYTCTAATVTLNLQDNNVLSGTATTSSGGGSPLTAVFTWFPMNAAGQIISDYNAAALGSLQITDYSGSIHNVQTRVIGYPNYDKALEEVPPPAPPPSNGGGDEYYDDDEVEV
jgi:hypothetical protein